MGRKARPNRRTPRIQPPIGEQDPASSKPAQQPKTVILPEDEFRKLIDLNHQKALATSKARALIANADLAFDEAMYAAGKQYGFSSRAPRLQFNDQDFSITEIPG
jgi:hypothetical protein